MAEPLAKLLPTVLGLSLLGLSLLWPCGCRREAPEPPAPAPGLHETAAASVTQLCDGRVRAWAVLDEHAQIVAHTRGACLGLVGHPEDGPLWHFVAQLQSTTDEQLSWELHTWLDGEGRPRHAEYRTPQLVTRFAWEQTTLAVHRLGDVLVIEDAAQLWVTPTHGVYLRELMLRLGVGRTATGLVQRGLSPERDAIVELAMTLEPLDADVAQARLDAGVIGLENVGNGLAGVQVSTVLAGDALIYRPLEHDELGN